MSNCSNYTNNQDADKNDSAANTLNAKNCLMKGKLSPLNCLIKVIAVTLLILALQYSNENKHGINGRSVVSDLESSNVRSLSEMHSNLGGSRESLYSSHENINERRNNRGNVGSQWRSHENLESSSYYGTYNNHAPREPGQQNMGELNLDSFSSGILKKVKENAIYVVPGIIAGYYAWTQIGSQRFLLIAAIIGLFLFARHNNSR
ncbi:hypothetical protein C922_04593 [Plasmodium inui San Antonio 1]|uniref:Uncharacterized protein n=1 Tax=Plasmodium inui San Antonio 1 TaxID=1237626 RepID=W7A073_9APIC|nr:hypothetical protein C922_04593 [Plasmodium inui San Antonio 1]XP_008819577.1 hypothetical protein C922_05784 [Plasmodium inui San Antonio 1]EUD63835.1 hypothetical protein C922_05784 [Plasmodium inui San Antonio 1]EUD64965.1 hypothetical protein C922_04593 [Plasmodium inui San Antonio 1]